MQDHQYVPVVDRAGGALARVRQSKAFAAVFIFSVRGVYAQQMILLCELPSATITAMFANEAGGAIYLIDDGLAAA
jgi:hypothetical protein